MGLGEDGGKMVEEKATEVRPSCARGLDAS